MTEQIFVMRCPHCQKNTDCIKLAAPPTKKKLDGAAHEHKFRCTECKMGWNIATGGSFEM